MNVIEFLSIDSSRISADLLVDKFEEDPDIFDTIVEVMYRDTYPLSMRAGRVVWLIAKKYPGFIKAYLPDMIDRLPDFQIDGVRRNIMSILVELPLPEIELGRLFNVCYDWVESEKEPVAIRGNAISILYKISEKEPGLKTELIQLFESLLPCNSMGIETRIRHYLKKLYRW
jgi:hypothetical protein